MTWSLEFCFTDVYLLILLEWVVCIVSLQLTVTVQDQGIPVKSSDVFVNINIERIGVLTFDVFTPRRMSENDPINTNVVLASASPKVGMLWNKSTNYEFIRLIPLSNSSGFETSVCHSLFSCQSQFS